MAPITTPFGWHSTAAEATFPLLEGIGGLYFEDYNEAAIVTQRTEDYSGVALYVLKLDNADHL